MMLKKKAMYILALLFLLIISISSASAMGINSTDEIVGEDLAINDEYTILNDDLNEIENENSDGENINAIGENTFFNANLDNSNPDPVLSDPQNITVGTKTFEAIQSAINGANEGDTIILSGTYSNNVQQPIFINKTLQFIGINNAILDANRYSSIFNVSCDVLIKNITFKNAYHEDYDNYGGAIKQISGNVSCINCTFINNHAHTGGALSRANAINCTFVNNSALTIAGAVFGGYAVNCTFINNLARFGGAMYSGTAVNCSFVNNSAGSTGGAMRSGSAVNCSFVNNSASSGGALNSATSFGCIFINNSALLGGAIYSYGNNIVNCSFVNNSANDTGAAIFFVNEGIIENCSFGKNNPIADSSLIYAQSSSNQQSSFNISGCNFINCSDMNMISIHNITSFGLLDSNFIACNSTNDSNYFIVFDNVQSTKIFNDSFVNCSFMSNGGILHLNYTFYQTLNISSCTFDHISFNDNLGLFHSNRQNICFDNCSFIKLSFDNNEGIKLVDGTSPSNFVNCYFKDNYVYNGTIINFNNNHFPSGTCHFINNTIHLGSLIYVENDLSNISNFSFENNTLYNFSLIDFKGINCSVSNCSFIDNFANNNGVLNFENFSSCNLIDCYFELNNASNLGGAIYSRNSSLNIENCTFINNSAASGGAIYAEGTDALLRINGSVFYQNHANAIHVTSDIRIENSTFDENDRAIYLENVSSSKFNNCTFIKNSANEGGAIYSILSNLSLENCDFLSNYAGIYKNGAALFIYESNFIVDECYFSKNHGIMGSGGDIFVTGFNDYALVKNSIFEENCSQADYGGISGNCNIVNSTFRNYHVPPVKECVCIDCLFENNAPIARLLYDSMAINCTFVNNTVPTIFLNTDVINCTFINNSASESLVCFTDDDDYEVINSTFIDNVAEGSGCAISVVNASLNISNSYFDNNACSGSGGAIFIENSTGVSINDCEFANCVSGDGSGAIKIDDSDSLDVSNCIFDVIPESIVVHYDSILLAEDLSFAIDSNGILIANLSDVRGPLVGKTITLTVDGNEYANTTDSNGLARFNMKNYFNSIGNYTVTLSFAGDDSINPSSANANINIFNYKGVLSVSSSGKYYEDVNVSFRLYDATRVAPISGANIRVDFSNGVNVTLVTDSEGSASYILPFAPGTYSLTATVIDDNVDVNTVMLHDIEISRISGKIDVTQAENVLNIRLFNQNTGEVYRNVIVNLNFNVMDDFNLTTNDQGIASYDMTVLGFGTYSAIVTVPGIYTDFNAEILSSIIVKNYTVDKTNSQVSFGKAIVFDYGKTGSTTVAVVGGIIEAANITVDGHPEAVVNIVDKVIYVSGLKVGSYTLHVKTTPDEYHYSVTSTIGITVRKVAAAIKASNHAAYSKENKKWSIKLIDTRTNKTLAKMQITLKIYTGSKYKTVKLTTNSKGIATIKASTLSVGKHKVVISFSKYGHSCSNLVRYVTVKKRIKLTYTTKSDSLVDGSNLFVWVKKSNKPINKVKIRMLVYTGSKYKEYVLTTGNYKSDGNVKKGFIGYGTNMLSAGKHKIVLKPYAYMYTGSKTAYMVIKKSAKKYKQSQVFVSNGKRSMNY